jgi:hypothetical protein
MVDLDETLYGGEDTEGDLDSILFNAVASTIPKCRTFKLLRLVQTDWWIWMKFCTDVMALNIVYFKLM